MDLASLCSPARPWAFALGLFTVSLPACALEEGGTSPFALGHDGGTFADGGARPPALDGSLSGSSLDGSIVSLDAEQPLDAQRPGSGDAAGEGGSCSLEGTFAIRVDVDVAWTGTRVLGTLPVLADGAGTLTLFASATLSHESTKPDALIAACGLRVPDFSAGLDGFRSELYGFEVPNRAWDQPTMPRWRFGWSTGCATAGCSFASERLEALIGAPELRPASTFWLIGSKTEAGLPDASDSDWDQAPGLTLLARGPDKLSSRGVPYHEPLLLPPLVRAQRVMLAMGLRTQLSGALESCDVISGTLSPQTELRTNAVDGVARDSLTGATPPKAEILKALENNLPEWQVRGGRFRAVRVPDAQCATARAAFARTGTR